MTSENTGLDGGAQQKKAKALREASRARKLHLAGAKPAANKSYETAIRIAPLDMDVVAVVADGIADLGHRDRAIDILLVALKNNPANETILTIVGKMAQNMDFPEIAAKVFSAAIDINPSEHTHYVNLAESYRQNHQLDDAVSLVKGALEMFPDASTLWNIMGTLMFNQRNSALALTFYEEAYRLDPLNDKILLNLANLKFDGGDPVDLYQRAIDINSENHSAHIGLATYQLLQGDLEAGWDNYEHRKFVDDGFSKSVRFRIDLPEWHGQPLAGKSILIMAEQGLGDEVFFGLNFERLYKEAEQLFIGCDPRLKTILQRSFPKAVVVGFEDQRLEGRRYRSFPDIARSLSKIDYCVWAGSVPKIWWSEAKFVPVMPEGYLRPDLALVEKYAPLFNKDNGRKKVGLSWRSSNLSFERSGYYFGLDGMALLSRFENVDYYCLQYGWDQSEIDWLQENADHPIQTFDDIDLKNDLESNLALMAHMDLVIGPGTATQQLSMCSGVPTWMITGGRPWWSFGERLECPRFAPSSFCSWPKHGIGQLELCRDLWDIMDAYISLKGIAPRGVTADQFRTLYDWSQR